MRKMLLIGILVTVVVGGSLLYISLKSDNKMTKEDAIRQAEQYSHPGTACGMALTPAVHVETGAKYTFSDTCIAPGWKPI